MSKKNKPHIVNSGYDNGGASRDRKTLKTWTPSHYSAKSDIDKNLNLLRDRAYDLAINSAIGHAAISCLTTGTVGSGLKLFPRPNADVLGISTEQAREWSRITKREFSLWADNALACDFLRRNNFFELQRIAFASCLVDGDSFCLFKRRVPTSYSPYSLRLQLIEAMRVSNPLTEGAALSTVEMKRGNHRIVNGIEVDSDGVLSAIWISNRIWNEFDSVNPELTWQRVRWFGRDTGCRNLLHICTDTRPDQYRGVPLLAPVIEPLKQISRYADAELTSAIIKSFFSIFFEQPQQNLGFNQIVGDNEVAVDVSEYRLGPATMCALPRGVSVKAIDSSNAQSTFDVFLSSFLKQIGAATGIPFEVLLHNFSSSYSASRAALLQAADTFRIRRAAFVQDFCAPIYEQFLTEAIALGRIKAEGFFDDPIKRKAWLNSEWFSENNRFIDPVKEAEGVRLRIALGLTTREKESAELCGVDFWENLSVLSEENKAMSNVMPQAETEGDLNGKS